VKATIEHVVRMRLDPDEQTVVPTPGGWGRIDTVVVTFWSHQPARVVCLATRCRKDGSLHRQAKGAVTTGILDGDEQQAWIDWARYVLEQSGAGLTAVTDYQPGRPPGAG
jgi:hypothetical protein